MSGTNQTINRAGIGSPVLQNFGAVPNFTNYYDISTAPAGYWVFISGTWRQVAAGGGGGGDVVGPAIAVNSDFALFDGVTGKLIKDGGLSLSVDGTLSANSDALIPSQKAVKTYVDAHSGALVIPITTGAVAVDFDANLYSANTIVLAVTTGGTAGGETLNILDFPGTYGGSNPPKNGCRVTAFLAVQTNPSDQVQVTGSNSLLVNPGAAVDRGGFALGYVSLGSVGDSCVFVWTDYSWRFDDSSGNNGASILAWGKSSPTDINQRIVWTNGGVPNWTGELGVSVSVEFITTGAAPVAASPSEFHHAYIQSGGTAGPESLTFAASNVYHLGFQKQFEFGARTNPADTIDIETANIQNADGTAMVSLTLTNANDFLLVEFVSPGIWQVVAASAGVCNPALAIASGTFLSADAKTVTVFNGQVVSIV